jgi:hypothetical protein
MTKVIVKEIFKVTADPMILVDVDKMVIVLDDGRGERRVVMAWEEFRTKSDFEKALIKALKDEKPKRKVVNMTQDWRGEYNI